MVYKFFDQEIGSGAIVTSKEVICIDEQLAEELHKPVIKKLKEEKSKQHLKTIFGQQIQLKWNHFLLNSIDRKPNNANYSATEKARLEIS